MTNVEAAAAIMKRRSEATPGEMYIKKLLENPEADVRKWLYSRSPVFELWKDLPGTIKLLTLPGHDWKLEYKLDKYRYKHGLKVQFTGVENDPAIWQISLTNRPKSVKSFEFLDVEEFIADSSDRYTAAWLDWNGPLSTTKLEAVYLLWPRLSHSLIVTFMASRYPVPVRKMYNKAGSWGAMLADYLKIPRDSVAEVKYSQGTGMGFYQLTALKSGKAQETKTCRYINGIKLEELYQTSR